ncbi:hypothetical protein [Pseudomonas sp. Hp2]|uniref:hypothetical protein n=1 Tax=Pseudomonas sp. Hp2 TaxID=701189 RepID=UPI00112C4978|nr:hypothetical protein [Pseudomonas sp. Hp2]
MSWTDLNADDVAQVSYPDRERGLTILREPGHPRIIVQAKAEGPNKVLFLRVPENLHARLKRRVSGSNTAAIVAIVEEALDKLEAGGERWRVVSREHL